MSEPDLRTSLQWLQAHGLSGTAECWILADDDLQPLTEVTAMSTGDIMLFSEPVWSEPSPAPLTYDEMSASLLNTYSGGGRLIWRNNLYFTYRGSYVVNPERAVFFLFLPQNIQIVDGHEEKMEQRRAQARELTRIIENGE